MPGVRAGYGGATARLPDQVVGHLELRVVGIVFRGRHRGFVARGLAVVEHDQARIAFAHLVAGGAWQQFVAVALPRDHQSTGGQLLAQGLVDQQGAVRDRAYQIRSSGTWNWA